MIVTIILLIIFLYLLRDSSYIFAPVYSNKLEYIHAISLKRSVLRVSSQKGIEEYEVIFYKKIKIEEAEDEFQKLDLSISKFSRTIFIDRGTLSKNLKKLYIAHACGNIDKKTYTNSLEAFHKNYNDGFRYFEVDINLTKDKKVILYHESKDWKSFNVKEIDFKDIDGFKYFGKYTLIGIDSILDIMKEKKDVKLILDFKRYKFPLSKLNKKVIKILRKFEVDYRNNPFCRGVFKRLNWKKQVYDDSNEIIKYIAEYLKYDREVLDRLIPQANKDNIYGIYQIYKFPYIIWKNDGKDKLKKDLLDMKEHNIDLWSVSKEYLEYEEVKNNRSKIITFTIAEKKEVQLLNSLKGGYTDLDYRELLK